MSGGLTYAGGCNNICSSGLFGVFFPFFSLGVMLLDCVVNLSLSYLLLLAVCLSAHSSACFQSECKQGQVCSVQYWHRYLTVCPNLSHRVRCSRWPVEAHFTSSQSGSHDAPADRRQAAGQRPRLVLGQPRGQWVLTLYSSIPYSLLSFFSYVMWMCLVIFQIISGVFQATRLHRQQKQDISQVFYLQDCVSVAYRVCVNSVTQSN